VALSVDASNRSLVTAGLDGVLRIWDFRKQKLTGACACYAPLLLQSGRSSSRNQYLTGAHTIDVDT
jgi:WD40 repeat protein